MCSSVGQGDNEYAVNVFTGEFAEVGLERRTRLPGYCVVIWRHGHVAEPTDLDPRQACGYWQEVLAVGRALRARFDPVKVKEDVAQLFGSIPRATVPPEPRAGTPVLSGVVRETIPDNVKLPKIVMAWHSPARFAQGDAELDLTAEILRDGKASRLYKALVYDHPLAQHVSAEQHSQDLTSYFTDRAADRLLLGAPGWYAAQGIELHLATRATRIDRASREVTTADGRKMFAGTATDGAPDSKK